MKKNSIDKRIALKGITLFDLFLILSILVLSTSFIIRSVFSNVRQDTSNKTAVIHCCGEEIKRMDLVSNTAFEVLGGKMQIISEDVKIRIAHSDCPENICVHSGWICHAGETLVCIPNQVVVEIIADTDPIVDAVAF